MPRTMDATLLADLSADRTTIVHFLEIASADPTAQGTLTKIQDGKLHDLQTSSLSDLTAFTVVSGNWSLSGGRILSEDNGPTHSLIRYDGYTGPTIGRVVQVLMQRTSVSAGMPGSAVFCEASGTTGWGTFIYAETGTTDLGGAGFWAVQALDESFFVRSVLDTNILGHFDPQYHIMDLLPEVGGIRAYFGDSQFIGRTVSFGSLGGTSIPDGRIGLTTRWEDTQFTPTPYPDDVFYDRLSVYSSTSILVVGLPVGAHTQIDSPEITTGGTGSKGGSTAPSTKISQIDLNGMASPYNRIRAFHGATTIADVTSVEVWGGDIWQYTPAGVTPELNFTSATERIDWGGKTWLPIHGHMGFSNVLESLDRSGQNVDVAIPGVVQAEIADYILTSNYKGRRVRLWVGHWDSEAGSMIGVPYMLWDGYLQNGFDLTESF